MPDAPRTASLRPPWLTKQNPSMQISIFIFFYIRHWNPCFSTFTALKLSTKLEQGLGGFEGFETDRQLARMFADDITPSKLIPLIEVDFLLQKGLDVLPVEVKKGTKVRYVVSIPPLASVPYFFVSALKYCSVIPVKKSADQSDRLSGCRINGRTSCFAASKSISEKRFLKSSLR